MLNPLEGLFIENVDIKKLSIVQIVSLYIYLSFIFIFLSLLTGFFIASNKIHFIASVIYISPIIIIWLTYLFRRRSLRFAYFYQKEIKLLGPFMRLFLYIFTTRFFYDDKGNDTMKFVYIFGVQASLISFYISFTIRNSDFVSSIFVFTLLNSVFYSFLESLSNNYLDFVPIAQNKSESLESLDKIARNSLKVDVLSRMDLLYDSRLPVDKRVLNRIANFIAGKDKVSLIEIAKINNSEQFIPSNSYVQYVLLISAIILFTWAFGMELWNFNSSSGINNDSDNDSDNDSVINEEKAIVPRANMNVPAVESPTILRQNLTDEQRGYIVRNLSRNYRQQLDRKSTRLNSSHRL